MTLISIALVSLFAFGCATTAPEKPKAPVPPSAKFETCRKARKNLRMDKGAKINEATPLKATAPEYPDAAKTDKVDGCALIVYDILPDGKADNIRVMEVTPRDKGFAEAAGAALVDWEFEKKPVKNVVLMVDFTPAHTQVVTK
jgi:outer membrane biosynthesis protein TonB